MIFRVLCVFLVASLVESCNPPLKTIYEVTPGFPTVDICDRTCTSKLWMAPGNVRTVEFKGKLKYKESPRELCHCMYKYIGQMGSDWLDGVTPNCYVKCNDLTLRLTGQPDPTYNSNTVDEQLDRPLEKLRGIFTQMKDGDVKVAKLVCKSKCIVDDCGCIHCMLECPLNGDPRDKDCICGEIQTYMNQGNWLEDAVTYCNQRGNMLEMEFVGNSKTGHSCVSSRYFTY